MKAINIVLIGAHPDDCELSAGGTAVKWARAGFRVLLVSVTNGDSGHFNLAGGPLALRRAAESRLSAERGGVDCLVLDNHDGELEPTLAIRKQIIRIIRDFEASIVITHRPNDYHPDHRYTAQLVQDAAYLVTVPNICPDVLPLRENPAFFYFMDHFEKPIPFHADIAVDVGDAMEVKWSMLDGMESQVYEWLPWHAGTLDSVPAEPAQRLKWLEKTWGPRFRQAAKKARPTLRKWYGKSKGDATKFAELFEVSEYGRQLSTEEIREAFPFFTRTRGKKRA